MIRVSNQESGPCFFNRVMFRVFFPIPSSFLISNVGNLFGRGEKSSSPLFHEYRKRIARWKRRRKAEKAEVSSSTDSRAAKEKVPASSRFAPVFFLGALPTGRAQQRHHYTVAKCPLTHTRLRRRIFSFPPLLLLAERESGRSARRRPRSSDRPSCPFLPSFLRE